MSSSSDGVKAQLASSGGTDQICVFCHTPHSAAPESPLWSRPDPTGPFGNGTFPVYADLKIGENDAIALTGYATDNPDYPNGASRMCLSCHDGVTSIGVLLGGAPIVMDGSDVLTNDGIPGNIQGVIDLATSHPISFNYNDNVINTLLGAAYQMPNAAVDTPLSNGQMQCTTCHDPHEDTSDDPNYGNLPFWRHRGEVDSYVDVCNNCHETGYVPTSSPHPLP